ncbi:transmembrane anchor protein [Gemmatimonas groenlandica]|uniref:Transmembrane anchor protein n=1 Tax=Gemmatimonas groenlandica TaxID=2732249 RepID=A0A6M4IL68_9BACT|nr:transmembrane anchor protein [Gemmatimonas groenlandica]QJR34629.1 transmembrane anchor protein [Gemmatimonas groenlandica]
MQQQDEPPDDLPSVRLLAWLSLCALLLAAFIGVAVVLPAETDRDPTGLGRVLGIAEMGRIKVALANEAVAEVKEGARAKTSEATQLTGSRWRDSMTITLQPSQGIEVKMSMRTAETARYAWTTDGGEVYFNMHGEPPNPPKDYAAHRYGKGTSAAESGELVAAFDGVHGWFWRNRTEQPITITLRTGGEYLVLKELK